MSNKVYFTYKKIKRVTAQNTKKNLNLKHFLILKKCLHHTHKYVYSWD